MDSGEHIDWELLATLRTHFLSENPAAGGDYWTSVKALEQYDATFAERIRWKWENVLEELTTLGWAPPSGLPWILDWGCGTGTASRTLLSRWPGSFGGVELFDRSKRAVDFAAQKISATPVGTIPAGTPYILLLSHILNEIDLRATKEIRKRIEAASAIFWVEPGTREAGKHLVEWRERFRSKFEVVAPCPHSSICGLTARENDRHWCHHFSKVPPEVFHSSKWSQFSHRLGIDLGSLPVSYLVLDQRKLERKQGQSRIIGRPRQYKGFTRVLACRETGVLEGDVRERDLPELHERLRVPSFAIRIDDLNLKSVRPVGNVP